MLRELVKLADHLDRKGLSKEADFLDGVIKKAMDDREIDQAMKDTGFGLPADQQEEVDRHFAMRPVDSERLMTPEGHDDGHSQALQRVIDSISALTKEERASLGDAMMAGGEIDI